MKLALRLPDDRRNYGMKKNVEMVRVVRETVGDDVDIMLECYMGFNYAYSRRLLKELEPYNLRWVEEMLLPDEIHNFAKLKKETSIPLSGGEHEYARYGFHDLLQTTCTGYFSI